jgi:outer membrane protein assembly factor BamB
MLEKFDAENIIWGITESPLIIDNKIIITPGGDEHNVVALNKNTGEIIWTTPAMGGKSAYCTPLYISDTEVPLIVTITAENIIGLEAATGKLLWSFECKNTWSIQANTPIYADNMVLFTTVEKGSTMVRLTNGGRNAEIAWELQPLDNMQGGLIKIGNYIYGSASAGTGVWYCVNWTTGEVVYRDETITGMSVIIYSDGMFYLYSDKGDMYLINPSSEKLDIVSQFKIELGTNQHWAHPIIYKGVLYVRHGDTLMAYNIKE